MLSIILIERLQLLLVMAKDPNNYRTAREHLAAAKELISTAFHLDAMKREEFANYHLLCMQASMIVSNAELNRSKDLPKTYTSFEDGVRPALSEDGAYRFNPLTGHHE